MCVSVSCLMYQQWYTCLTYTCAYDVDESIVLLCFCCRYMQETLKKTQTECRHVGVQSWWWQRLLIVCQKSGSVITLCCLSPTACSTCRQLHSGQFSLMSILFSVFTSLKCLILCRMECDTLIHSVHQSSHLILVCSCWVSTALIQVLFFTELLQPDQSLISVCLKSFTRLVPNY